VRLGSSRGGAALYVRLHKLVKRFVGVKSATPGHPSTALIGQGNSGLTWRRRAGHPANQWRPRPVQPVWGKASSYRESCVGDSAP
jgi:hypothetical protein